MKVKTTLAALLLAAVMVTPSYGASRGFLDGAEDELRERVTWSCGYFAGVCVSLADSRQVGATAGVSYGQLQKVVARYVYNHPEYHHEHESELVKRACKQAWPNENKHIFISR
jgi:hypothetical protein